MGRRKGVAHVEVAQGGQLLHQQGLGLLLVGQAQLHLEEGLLLRHEPHVIEEQHFALPERGDGCPGRGPAHVVDPLYLPAQEL